jgi:RNA polymerase sigma-70 factor (ECF subfamily)
VLAAGQCSSAEAQDALEKLCRAYWFPLYSYVRRKGHEPADAQDLTQEFFARLLARNYLGQVDPKKGKLRSFLLAAMNHFLANEWDRNHRVKRGGRVTLVSLDEAAAEERYALEPVNDVSPETIFERRWAVAVLDAVLSRLRDEFVQTGRTPQFERLKVFLSGEKTDLSYAELAAQMETTEGVLKMAVQRMRQRCGQLLREEIAQTVANPAQVEEEIRCLFATMAG